MASAVPHSRHEFSTLVLRSMAERLNAAPPVTVQPEEMVELADSFELIAHSIHPYTRSLISAIPVADPITARQSKRIVLQGDVPSPLNPPSGCRFRTRCPYADERCAAEVPEFKEVTSGHWAACHHLDKVK